MTEKKEFINVKGYNLVLEHIKTKKIERVFYPSRKLPIDIQLVGFNPNDYELTLKKASNENIPISIKKLVEMNNCQ